MTARTIQLLSQSIPDHILAKAEPAGRQATVAGHGYDADIHRFVLRYRSVDFGWKYATLSARHKEIPLMGGLLGGQDEVIFRAHLFARSPETHKFPDIKGALALTLPSMRSTRIVLEGLLLANDATVVSAAAHSGIDVAVVRAFEKLFFNVLDRKNDVAYLQHVIYPHGRLVELMDNYMRTTDLGMLIRRAGYNNGSTDVLFLMGATNSAVAALSQASSARTLEQMMMGFAYVMARNGALNQSDTTAISNAKALLTAGKLGGSDIDDRPVDDNLANVLRSEMIKLAPKSRAIDLEES